MASSLPRQRRLSLRAAGSILRPALFWPLSYLDPVTEPITYHIALGSNLGDRAQHLQSAVHAIHEARECRVMAASSIWETEAHVQPGQPDQPAFLNAVIACESGLAPEDLIELLFEIETQHGRDRSTKGRWQPRPLDLDIILAGANIVKTTKLDIPHPRLDQRRFVLGPLAEIAADVHVPSPFDERVGYLLSICPDQTDTVRYSPLQLPHRA